jgi:hypothetical protein
MPSLQPAAARPRLTGLALAACLVFAACTSATPSVSPSSAPSGSAPGSPAASDPAGPTPVPTPQPTPRFTNEPDPGLARLIPNRVRGVAVSEPPITDFAYTPGDIGEQYGELGLRFESLQVAYIENPRLSLFAVRVAPPEPTTAELEPYLAAAGQYVGIAGLHREPWKLRTIEGRRVWVRPEDDATLAGTMVYSWAADGFVFLMIGVDDTQNRAMLAALPGERPPAATPSPTRSARPSPTATASAQPASD